MKSINLSDGTSAPWLAFGTGTALYQKEAKDSVLLALKHGFIHIDAAQMYENEDSVGEAIVQSGKKREEIFVTTKLDKLGEGESVSSSIEGSLKKLKIDHADLFLTHVPTAHEGRVGEVWKEMVEAKKKGLTKSIGVSNFNVKYLEEIRATGLEMPVVNQIEFHPFVYHGLVPLLKYHADHGIVTASYGGAGQLSTVLNKLAAARSANGKDITQDQVLFKWLQSKNILAVTTSSNATRLDGYIASENLTDLTEEDVFAIDSSVGTANFRVFASFKHMDDQTLPN